jgi:mRNA interferase YafQ
MKSVAQTRAFKKDLKRLEKRGKDLGKLRDLVLRLANGETLETSYRNHPLQGPWKPKWDCHIEPDWLLIYEATEEAVILVRSGTHADLFG